MNSEPNADKAPKSGNSGKSRDWMDLPSKVAIPIIIPLVAALVAAWFTVWQSHLTDRQHQDDAMETYIGNMKDLFSQGQSTSNPNLSQIADGQTVTTLRELNAQRNRIVLQFLQGAHLIGGQDPHIHLSDANLSNDDLGNAPLGGIDLRSADLSHADLAGADLSGAIMNGADLTGADLSGAILTSASLTDASLAGADLDGAHLGDTILTSADLGGADLGGADLGGADLPGANITQSQLDEVGSCAEAILSSPLTCRPICSFAKFTPGCQKSPIELTYWYTESAAEAPVIKALVNEFNQANPGIQVTAVQTDFFHARAAFISAVHQGNAPDVFRSDVSWTPLFASEGYLLNLDKYVPQNSLSDYQNAPLSTTRGLPSGAACGGTGPEQSAPLSYDWCNGHLYGLPQEIDFPVLLYNKAEFKQAGINPDSYPTTMDAFKKDAIKIVQDKQDKAVKYGFEFGGTSYYALPFLYACGGGMFSPKGNIVVNSPQSVAGLKFLVDLQNAEPRVMPPVANVSTPPGTMLPDFMDGTTAMIFDGVHDISSIVNSGKAFVRNKHYNGNLGIAPVPAGTAGQPGSPLGGESYVISAGTAHPAEAYEFINFMSSPSSQEAIAEANYTLPTRKSAYKYLAKYDPFSYQFISKFVSPPIVQTVVPPLPVPQASYLFDAADPYIWDALKDMKSADALTDVQIADEALSAIAYSWNQLGGWKLQPWPASSAACL